MKNFIIVCLLTIVFVACTKADNELYCWTCVADVAMTDNSGTVSTFQDTSYYCDLSTAEIKTIENRYQARELGQYKYSDLKCEKRGH